MTAALIAEFLAQYRQRRRPHGSEHAISDADLAEILEEFALFEMNEELDVTRLELAMQSLRRLTTGDRAIRRAVETVEKEIGGLRATLQRQRHANRVMQEHLVMISDQLRRPSQPDLT